MSQNLLDPATPSGPVTVNNLSIHIDRDLCIGAATCLAIAPEVYALDNEAKAIIIDSAANDSDQNIIDAARACPTAAISITDKDGNKVFPK